MDSLSSVLLAYNLGHVTKTIPMTNGKSSMAWRVETISRPVLVKTVPSTEQALLEFALTQAIQDVDSHLTPAILCTRAKQPFITMNRQIYQVQRFWEHQSSALTLAAALSCYLKIRKGLDQFEYDWQPQDPQPLQQLWQKQQAKLQQTQPAIYAHLVSQIESLLLLDQAQEAWVHGDLGRWNLLTMTNKQVGIIDFGQARRGPRFLDFAALYHGFMPRQGVALSAYTERFCHLAGISKVDRLIFLATVRLWLVKGLLVAVDKATDAIKVFDQACHQVEQLT
ncbi:aminoglycoside phosphotransferase family protein [Lactobacillus rhamnosus]|uniref:Aminoglycoside phosphotransferase family protein n=1 Tax=Lacticaseibacillus rhamnosus TaxID=47715 RepID=A0A7Y7UJD1_LACRH|nr:aminoglycoside phosphotransferase family protein [Lacticaseibacillus rhamnosus]NVO89382.1 aminoglycoside phosphotransferase family protein [Lacticaseibacillus rhamnosus]